MTEILSKDKNLWNKKCTCMYVDIFWFEFFFCFANKICNFYCSNVVWWWCWSCIMEFITCSIIWFIYFKFIMEFIFNFYSCTCYYFNCKSNVSWKNSLWNFFFIFWKYYTCWNSFYFNTIFFFLLFFFLNSCL